MKDFQPLEITMLERSIAVIANLSQLVWKRNKSLHDKLEQHTVKTDFSFCKITITIDFNYKPQEG